MFKSTEANPTLTFDQLQAIDVAQKRLTNLQNEISVAKEYVFGIRKETESVTKEKAYQEDLLTETKNQVTIYEDKKQILMQQVSDAQTKLEDLNKKTVETDAAHTEKTNELSIREHSLLLSEENHKKVVEDFNTKSNQLLEDQLAVKTAKEAFLKANESITW